MMFLKPSTPRNLGLIATDIFNAAIIPASTVLIRFDGMLVGTRAAFICRLEIHVKQYHFRESLFQYAR